MIEQIVLGWSTCFLFVCLPDLGMSPVLIGFVASSSSSSSRRRLVPRRRPRRTGDESEDCCIQGERARAWEVSGVKHTKTQLQRLITIVSFC